MFYCPKCGYPQYCGCSSNKCRKAVPKDKKPQIDLAGNLCKCANCGLTKSMDWWEQLTIDIFMYDEKENQ